MPIKQSVEQLEKELLELQEQEVARKQHVEVDEDIDIEESPKKPVVITKPEDQSEDEELSAEEKQYKKRYGDLRKHSQKKEKELQDRITALENKISENPSNNFPVTKEDVKKWATDNPKAAALIRAIALEENEDKFKELDRLSSEISKEKGEARVLKVHPDFYDIVEDDEFHDWAGAQPSFIQDRIYDNPDPEETIWALDLYKKENGKIKDNEVRDAAKGVKTKSRTDVTKDQNKGRFTESMVAQMSDADFEKHWEEIQRDRKLPGFYDLSAGAR